MLVIQSSSLTRWKGFEGFNGKGKPLAIVKKGVGVENSNCLSITHTETFRTDGWGVRTQLSKPISEGVVWVQCSIKPPKHWKSGIFFDMRGDKSKSVIARVAGAPYKAKGAEETKIRWHSVFTRPYWRLYTTTSLEQRWYKLTARIDYQHGTYACWVDNQTLGEDLPLTSK